MTKLQREYIQECGDIVVPEMVTDIIPKGVSILYGATGVGKTKSIVKHLNRFNVEPLLLDFDSNEEIYHDLKCELISGEWFINRSRKRVKEIANRKKDMNLKIVKILNEYYKNKGQDRDVIVKQQTRDKCKKFIENEADKLDDNTKEVLIDCLEEVDKNISISEVYELEHKVILIDTYAYCIPFFDDDLHFERFVNNLTKIVESVIIVSHETGERGDDTEVNAVFTNHAQAKFRLKRDLTKTKGEEINLFIKKLRGYKGKPIIKNWERG